METEPDADKQVARIFEQLGAPSSQASKMAKQLVKRAEQFSKSENVPFLEALNRLLQLSIDGIQGEIDPNFRPISKKSQKS